MGLSVKLALVICLAVTGGTCWLVNQVARPILNLASPLTEQRPDGAEAGGVRTVAERFARPSAVVSSPDGAAAVENLETAVVRESAPTGGAAERETLPPLVLGGSDERMGDAVARRGESSSELNDELLTPSSGRGGPILLVASRGGDAPPTGEAGFASSERAEVSSAREYVVRSGDSLAKICKAELGSTSSATIESVLAANPSLKGRANLIFAGQKLVLPPPGSSGGVASSGRAATEAAKKPATVKERPAQRPNDAAVAKSSPKKPATKTESAKANSKTSAKTVAAKSTTAKSAPAKGTAASAKAKPASGKPAGGAAVRTAAADSEAAKRDVRKAKTARPG